MAAIALSMVSCGAKKEVVKEDSKTSSETVQNTKAEEPKQKTKSEPKQIKLKSDLLPFEIKGVSFNMVKVQGGTYTMGATSEQSKLADPSEKPAHKVTVANYYIGETEVTQELWNAVMGNNPSKYKGENFPVESVSWTSCQTFLKRLSDMTGKSFRLPTEAEWEYAARGGNMSQGFVYSGSNLWMEVAIRDKYATSPTYKVASTRPNELGLYDMTGNVSEWCSDWYGAYSSAAQEAPKGPQTGESRIYRGGSATMPEIYYRNSARDGGVPDKWFYTVGLRLAMTE